MLSTRQTQVLFLLFFLSGAAALIYEVLWLKELGLLFGVTAYAAATTLAVFFLGLSAGSLVWGRKAARISNLLATYAVLEIAIAGTALLYFLLFDLYQLIFDPLYAAADTDSWTVNLVKFFLALGILFLPAFFMGGTLPVMGQFLVRKASNFGRTVSWLYAINTLGAAVGALSAGIFLPPLLGFNMSYGLAIGINLAIAAIAFIWSRKSKSATVDLSSGRHQESEAEPAESSAGYISSQTIVIVAAVSGFATLGIEVLWTRMYAQVLQNSVFTFSIILTLFLLALAVGSGVAHVLCRRRLPPADVLSALLLFAGVTVAITPLLFYAFNPELQAIGADLGWRQYLIAVFLQAAVILLPAGICVGCVFPYLMKVSERYVVSAGKTVGKLASVNTFCAILGSLVAGFFMLDAIGLWRSLSLFAVIYFVVAFYLSFRQQSYVRALVAVFLAALVGLLWSVEYRHYSVAALDTSDGETAIAVYEGSQGTVVVTKRGESLRLKVNSAYTLGSSSSALNERIQGWLPLALHSDPKSVFFLGVGTGITAGAALNFPIDTLVACELIRDVVTASKDHFRPFLNNLFTDPRADVLVEDGRTFLRASNREFDVIISDIFLTYKAGVGKLYTIEHFEVIKSKLKNSGIFVQWLPMFDLSEREFGILARTMLEVFPEITIWRRGFSPRYGVFALVVHKDSAKLPRESLRQSFQRLESSGHVPTTLWLRQMPLGAYVGNLGSRKDDFAGYPVNTDNLTILEYLAPKTEREHRGSRSTETYAWVPLADFCDSMAHRTPFESDPYLSDLNARELDQIRAGLAFQKYEAHRRTGNTSLAQQFYDEFLRLTADGSSATE